MNSDIINIFIFLEYSIDGIFIRLVIKNYMIIQKNYQRKIGQGARSNTESSINWAFLSSQ